MKFLINRDNKKIFKISFIQSIEKEPEFDSIILSIDGKKYLYSTAIIKSLILLGGIYKLAWLLFIIPKALRDFFYKLIAKHRYKWFGKHKACPTIPNDWKERLI
jgi:predicted DCC family thiol-disulfide oxidoreductase YuxK